MELRPYQREAVDAVLEQWEAGVRATLLVLPTGCGKTTLVSMIPRLYDVTEGVVKVGGVDVRDYDLNTLRNSVAMVLQKNLLFSGSVAENLRWGDENATDFEIGAEIFLKLSSVLSQ